MKFVNSPSAVDQSVCRCSRTDTQRMETGCPVYPTRIACFVREFAVVVVVVVAAVVVYVVVVVAAVVAVVVVVVVAVSFGKNVGIVVASHPRLQVFPRYPHISDLQWLDS